MENIIRNIKTLDAFDVARKIANDNQEKTGVTTIVRRVVDYEDVFNGRVRQHFSFDVVEIVGEA